MVAAGLSIPIRMRGVVLFVQPVFQLLAVFEKGQLLWFDLNLPAGFGIPAGVCVIRLDIKRAQSADFNTGTFGQRPVHFVEKDIDDRFRFGFGDVTFPVNNVDQFQFVQFTLQKIVLATGYRLCVPLNQWINGRLEDLPRS